ncbi:MAG TPA: tetratricopeptide repeat protein, partial [Thermoplasmata archaeon]|nr:tetratricopeptide repeat protein [Thermoplasmata archaeon]
EAIAQMTGPVTEVSEAPVPITDFSSLAKAFEAIEDEVEPPAPSVPSDFQSFVESIEPEKEDTHVLLQLAELAMEGGDPQMGLLRYEQAIERDLRNADAWTGKGVALQQLERFREALEAYDRALSLKPNHELARKWRETCARHVASEANE